MTNEKLKPFFNAIPDVFKQMFNMTVKNGEIKLIEGNENHKWEVSGLLGIAGSHQGVVALRFAKNTVDELLKLSGVESNDEEDRLATTSALVAEITNIIAGNAISCLTDLNLDISPPVVIKGKNHEISWPKIAPVVALEYSSQFGNFELAICFNA